MEEQRERHAAGFRALMSYIVNDIHGVLETHKAIHSIEWDKENAPDIITIKTEDFFEYEKKPLNLPKDS